MIKEYRACLDIAQQLHAVEHAITTPKKLVNHDHLDECLAEIAVADPA